MVEAELAKEAINKSLLEALLPQIEKVGQDAKAMRDDAQSKVAEVSKLLDTLGPAPGPEDPPEEESIATRRSALQAQLVGFETEQKQSDLTATRANQAVAKIRELVFAKFTERIFERGPSPLSLTVLLGAGPQFLTETRRLLDAPPEIWIPILAGERGLVVPATTVGLFVALALIAGVLAARLWVRLSKSEAFETEHLTSLFIYEFGVLFLPLLGIIYIFEYTVLDLFIGGIKPESKLFFAGDLIFSASHLLLFLLVLGRCAKLTIWRSVWSAAVVVLALVFLFLLGMILSIPFYLLPLLLLLYPVYALVRKFMSKAAFAEKFFEGIEGRITSGDALLSPREQARPEEGGSTS